MQTEWPLFSAAPFTQSLWGAPGALSSCDTPCLAALGGSGQVQDKHVRTLAAWGLTESQNPLLFRISMTPPEEAGCRLPRKATLCTQIS